MYTTNEIAKDILSEFLTKVRNGNSNMFSILQKRYPTPHIMQHFSTFCHNGKELATIHDIIWNAKLSDRNLLFTPHPMLATQLLKDLGTGNCKTLSLAYVYDFITYLIDNKINLEEFSIEVVAATNILEMDHVFVLLNRKPHQSLENRLLWGAGGNCIIVDPWLRVIFNADKWEYFMTPFARELSWGNPSCPSGFKVIWDDKTTLARIINEIKYIESESQKGKTFLYDHKYLRASEYLDSLYPTVSQEEKAVLERAHRSMSSLVRATN